MIVVGMFWNVHCIEKVVLKNKFNFTCAVIRSNRSSCSYCLLQTTVIYTQLLIFAMRYLAWSASTEQESG